MGGDWRSYPSPLVAAVRLPRRDGEQEGGTEEMERERGRERRILPCHIEYLDVCMKY